MANVSVFNIEGKEVEKIELNDAVFGVEVNEHLVHMAVVATLEKEAKVEGRSIAMVLAEKKQQLKIFILLKEDFSYAEKIYYDRKREWNKMIDRSMAVDFSWHVSANKYQEMYDWLIG